MAAAAYSYLSVFSVCTLFLTRRLLRRVIQHSALDQRIQKFLNIFSCRLFIHIV